MVTIALRIRMVDQPGSHVLPLDWLQCGRTEISLSLVGDDRGMADLVGHLELFLGPIEGGTRGDDSTPVGVQAIWFGADAPFAGVTTWATLGLSNHHLTQPSGRALHQELVMHLPNARQPANTAGVLFQVADE